MQNYSRISPHSKKFGNLYAQITFVLLFIAAIMLSACGADLEGAFELPGRQVTADEHDALNQVVEVVQALSDSHTLSNVVPLSAWKIDWRIVPAQGDFISHCQCYGHSTLLSVGGIPGGQATIYLTMIDGATRESTEDIQLTSAPHELVHLLAEGTDPGHTRHNLWWGLVPATFNELDGRGYITDWSN